MAKTEPKHPRLTPLRAIELLRVVERAVGEPALHIKNNALLDVAGQLQEHIAAELVSKRRRR